MVIIVHLPRRDIVCVGKANLLLEGAEDTCNKADSGKLQLAAVTEGSSVRYEGRHAIMSSHS